jgi:hypothetical protein
MWVKEQDVPPKLVCTGVPTNISEGVELVSDARDGLKVMISLHQLGHLEAHLTVLTIMLSSSMRKLMNETAATTVKRGNPVRYSRSGSGFCSTIIGFSFVSALGFFASSGEASGEGGLSVEDCVVAIVEALENGGGGDVWALRGGETRTQTRTRLGRGSLSTE